MPSVGWIRYNAQAKLLTVMVGKEMAAVFDKNAISVPIFLIPTSGISLDWVMEDGLIFLIAPKSPM